MLNKAMERLIKTGQAINLAEYKRTPEGYYVIENMTAEYIEKCRMDFCNAETETWIWSIGQHIETGAVHASENGNLYKNPMYKTVWLR